MDLNSSVGRWLLCGVVILVASCGTAPEKPVTTDKAVAPAAVMEQQTEMAAPAEKPVEPAKEAAPVKKEPATSSVIKPEDIVLPEQKAMPMPDAAQEMPIIPQAPASTAKPAMTMDQSALLEEAAEFAEEKEVIAPEKIFVVTSAPKDASHPFYGKGSKLAMIVDGEQGKELILTRGKTYGFRVKTDVKHDFYISYSPVGWGAQVFANNVKGNFTYDGFVIITVTDETPDVLYYQCRNHKSMGGKINIVNPGEEGKIKVRAAAAKEATKSTVVAPTVSKTAVIQKISFANMFINQSNAAKRILGSNNSQAKESYRSAQQKLAGAQKAMDEGQYAEAIAITDEALRLMSTASRQVPTAAQLEEQRTHFSELLEGVKSFEKSYKRNLEQLKKQGKKDFRTVDLDQIHAMVDRAQTLADKGDFAEANKVLSKAQGTITAVLSEMMDDETVVYDLNFATPAEEYEYELARYESYLELVPIAIEQKQPSEQAVVLMNQFVDKAKGIHGLALGEAKKENYPTAIQMLQGATSHLIKSLQMVGVR